MPGTTLCEQSVPQLMPAGELMTVPLPVPFLVTVSVTGLVLKVAVTDVAVLTVTLQLPVPLQAPLQPAKVEPAAAVAVSVNWAPGVTVSEQSVPQLIPVGVLLTVPLPVPLLVTVSATGATVAEPFTAREMMSPLALKFTLAANVPATSGVNRTVTIRLAPADRENEPPDKIVNGAPTLTPTEMLAVLVFCTVNAASAVLPAGMLPKLVVVVGVTLKSARATPLAEAEHPLSLPTRSTAVTVAMYVVPALRPTMRLLTMVPGAGADVGDETVWNDALGHAGSVVPR